MKHLLKFYEQKQYFTSSVGQADIKSSHFDGAEFALSRNIRQEISITDSCGMEKKISQEDPVCLILARYV